MTISQADELAQNVDSVTSDDVDRLLASELNAMTVQEREVMYEEIHGVETLISETPEMIDTKLAELDAELIQLSNTTGDSNETNYEPNAYTSSRNFRLMFLHAEQFHVEKAAQKLMQFMQTKAELFGTSMQDRRVYLSDLDADDKATLRSGVFQLLPSRDRSGRPIIGNFRKLLPRCYKYAMNMARVLFYIVMATVEDDEQSQKRGVVGIMYFVGGEKMEFDSEMHALMPKVLLSLPLRVTGFHLCMDSSTIVRMLKPLLMAMMGPALRVRLRIHNGSHTECQYSLLSYGIPPDALPVTANGFLKLTSFQKWCRKRKQKDAKLLEAGVFVGIDLPAREDVLLGRGKSFQDHQGTVAMRQLVIDCLEYYTNATNGERIHLTWKIVDSLKLRNVRFLQRNSNDWWEEVDDEIARQKVNACFKTVNSTRRRAKHGNERTPVPNASPIATSHVDVGGDGLVPGSKRLRPSG